MSKCLSLVACLPKYLNKFEKRHLASEKFIETKSYREVSVETS